MYVCTIMHVCIVNKKWSDKDTDCTCCFYCILKWFTELKSQESQLSMDIKSNQIKSLLLSHHHSTSALVSEILMSVLQTVQKTKQKNNNLHMDSTYLQTVQKTMCKIHIHILSTHSVLYRLTSLSTTHYTPYVHIYIMYTIYTLCSLYIVIIM